MLPILSFIIGAGWGLIISDFIHISHLDHEIHERKENDPMDTFFHDTERPHYAD